MKIEMGESLLCSWLKHIKGCQLVQLNWAVSPNWDFQNKDIIQTLMDRSNALFLEKYGYNIYKNNSLEQLIAQSEADVVGIALDENGSHIYAVDVAFHEAGLNYGSREETVARVVKKCLRTAMCVLGCFNIPYGDIVFASPKITPAVYKDMVGATEDVNAVLRSMGLEYNVSIYANEKFEAEILKPVMQSANTISDTSELYMRSLQLCKLFYKDTATTAKTQTPRVKSQIRMDKSVAQSVDDCIVGFEDVKVAEIARTVLVSILQSGKLSAETVEQMQDNAYSKQNFDLQYPLLRKVMHGETRPIRYFAKPIVHIANENFYLCSEWFEQPGGNNDRPYLLKWIALNR